MSGKNLRPIGLIFLIVGLIFACTDAFAQNGTLIIAGGGVSPRDEIIWRAIADEGGSASEILVISAGSSEPEAAGAEIVTVLRRYSAKATLVPLSVIPNAFAGSGGKTATDPAWISRARAARGFFFAGGAQGRIVDALAPQGQGTPLLHAIREAHAAGAFVSGTSAGAAIMSGTMFRDPSGQLEMLLRGPQGEDIGAGLGFLAQPWLVDQHFLARDRHLRLLSGLCKLDHALLGGLGVDEGTALVVRGDEAEVIGRSGVIVMRLRGAKSCAPLHAQARITLAHPGDKISLRDGVVHGSAPGFAVVSTTASEHIRALPGSDTLRGALERLVGAAEESTDLAIEARAGGRIADIGWIVHVRSMPGTLRWPAGERVSVADALLEIAPFRILQDPIHGAGTR